MTAAGSETPWEVRDRRSLTDHAVREIVRSRFPEIPCARLEKAGEGWDFEVYRVDDFAFRFAKQARWAEQQRREVPLLERLAPRLPIAVPQPVRLGEPHEDFPFPFVGYRWLEGHGGDALLPAPLMWPRFARTFGNFLRALHACDVDLASKPGEAWTVRQDLEKFEVELRSVLAPDVFDHAMGLALDGSVQCSWPLDPVPIHGDLCPEHWLFSPGGELTGVIDWTDARRGDPTSDFIGPWIWFGDEVLRQTLSVYGRLPVPDFVARIRSRAIGKILTWIGEWARWPDTPKPIHDRATSLWPRLAELLGRSVHPPE